MQERPKILSFSGPTSFASSTQCVSLSFAIYWRRWLRLFGWLLFLLPLNWLYLVCLMYMIIVNWLLMSVSIFLNFCSTLFGFLGGRARALRSCVWTEVNVCKRVWQSCTMANNTLLAASRRIWRWTDFGIFVLLRPAPLLIFSTSCSGKNGLS